MKDSWSLNKAEITRPQQSFDAIMDQRRIDAVEFLKEKGSEFVPAQCPVCGHEGQLLFDRLGYKHMLCRHDGTVFLSPRPTKQLLNEYYNQYPSPKMWLDLLIETESERKKRQWAPSLQRILDYLGQMGIENAETMVDMGAGSGAFAQLAKESEFFQQVIAADISSKCIEFCREKSLEFIQCSLDTYEGPDADLLCLNDSFEHFSDQNEILELCHRHIKPGGFLSIMGENCDGLEFKVLLGEANIVAPPEHVAIFNMRSITMILEKHGFEVAFLVTPAILDVEIVLAALKKGQANLENMRYLEFLLSQSENVLIEFQRFLTSNCLTGHLHVLARKK